VAKKPPKLPQSSPQKRRKLGAGLLNTHPAGKRVREQEIILFAQCAARGNWSEDRCHIAALTAVKTAVFGGRIQTEKAFGTAVREFRIATHPKVRAHVSRLAALRDEAYARDPVLLRTKLHGPYQVFSELLRFQLDPQRRWCTSSAEVYLNNVRQRPER
jgi:hypothetical protein